MNFLLVSSVIITERVILLTRFTLTSSFLNNRQIDRLSLIKNMKCVISKLAEPDECLSFTGSLILREPFHCLE